MSNNPLVRENIISKIKTKKSKKEVESSNSFGIETYLVGMNRYADICAEACACCWDKVVPEGFQNVAEYIAKRTRIGHTSVIEHSNYVVYMSIGVSYTDSLLEFLDTVEYLETKIIKSLDGLRWHFLIGGSLRGFSDLYRESCDLNNPILKHITSNLYTYSHSAMFEDICKLGLMDKERFMNVEPDDNFNLINSFEYSERPVRDLFDIVNMDNISRLYSNLYNIDKEAAQLITTYDLIKFCSITVLFKNMSRASTHQLVRHRNGITQESQRYVDYSKSCFSSPEKFKPERYDSSHKYTIRFGSSAPMHMTLSEIGKAMCDVYGMLHNPSIAGAEHALLKEDARGYLPTNVQCKKIYITFTFKNFLKFLELREDRAAQAEIRTYAIAVGEWFRSVSKFNTKELCSLYTKPRLLIEDPFKIDVDEGVSEETVELTEDDYIKAAGLDIDDETTPEEE